MTATAYTLPREGALCEPVQPRPAETLVCHPGAGNPAVRALRASASLLPGGVLAFAFLLEADLAGVRLPPKAAEGRTDGLWHHTCFEAFIAGATGAAYEEFNFSPTGQWAAYAFRAYREGMAPLADVAPDIVVQRGADWLQLEARVAVTAMPDALGQSPRLAGLSAVIEDGAGGLSYWALRHPADAPDFHHRQGFALCLADGERP